MQHPNNPPKISRCHSSKPSNHGWCNCPPISIEKNEMSSRYVPIEYDTDDAIHIIDPRTGYTFCEQSLANLLSPLQAITMWDLQQSQFDNWKGCWTCLRGSDRYENMILDRDYRDCIAYAAIMFDDPGDWGGAMFDLSPAEIISWHWEEIYETTKKS